MFLDTNFNSLSTVLSSIFQNFVESSMKYYRYAKCMVAHPPVSLLIGKLPSLPGSFAEIFSGTKPCWDSGIGRPSAG
jgi:hypothetical protein